MIAGIRKQFDRYVWGDGLTRHGPPGRLVAGVLRNLYAVTRDIASGQLNLRAMSLVYTTLLSVVPLIAVSFSAIRSSTPSRLRSTTQPCGRRG